MPVKEKGLASFILTSISSPNEIIVSKNGKEEVIKSNKILIATGSVVAPLNKIKIDEKNIPEHDLLFAGFPCQAFSISGKRLGFEDARGTLFFDVARIIKFHNPKVIFLENVAQFCSFFFGKLN